MDTLTESRCPKLRAVDARLFIQDGRPSILLRDPLQLADKTVVIPQQLAPLLALCDGTRDSDGLRASLAVRFGLRVGPDVLEHVLATLDEALLLDNDRFAQARERALAKYRQAPFRPPILAGQSYPADTDELRHLLQGYIDAVDDVSPDLADGRGLVCPHIDYARGGPVYARVWKRAAEMVKTAELVVLLGTDHFGKDGRLTLTRQHYATPLGMLPTDCGIVETLAGAMGAETVFADEIHHRCEHSIELAAVWLHYMRAEQPCELVPILCGPFGHFVRGEAKPEHDPVIKTLLDTLTQAAAGRRVIIVAAGDLSHVGPAFGGQPLGLMERARLQAADDELIEQICAGHASGFFVAIKREGDRRHVCGLPPIYLALRLLNPVQGERVAYDRCPADRNGTSLVSVCGIVFK
ncbi:MAG: AmmeMemoRadiSam system protein B [Chloroflexota bacterium]|nr:AmmeMemoRadiSam system protein B [Chloroflexota bacterium]